MSPYVVIKGVWCQECFFEDNAAQRRARTFQEVLNRVEAMGGHILTQEYLYREQVIDFHCANGHLLSLRPSYIKILIACAKCPKEGRNRLKIERQRARMNETQAAESARSDLLQKRVNDQLANLQVELLSSVFPLQSDSEMVLRCL